MLRKLKWQTNIFYRTVYSKKTSAEPEACIYGRRIIKRKSVFFIETIRD